MEHRGRQGDILRKSTKTLYNRNGRIKITEQNHGYGYGVDGFVGKPYTAARYSTFIYTYNRGFAIFCVIYTYTDCSRRRPRDGSENFSSKVLDEMNILF